MMSTNTARFRALIGGFEGFLDSLRDRKECPAPDAGRAGQCPPSYIGLAPPPEGAQCSIRQALRELRAATDLSCDLAGTISWYRNEPLLPFHYETAEQLVSEGRTEDVLRYVEFLETGANR